MKEEISSMIFTDVNGEWKRIYTSEEVIENLQNDKAKLQQRIDKAIEIIKREFLCYDNESAEYKWGKILLKILGDKENDKN